MASAWSVGGHGVVDGRAFAVAGHGVVDGRAFAVAGPHGGVAEEAAYGVQVGG
ncbi:hypothetical protein BH790_gp01 [Gordonia phage Gsput1]|uniref:Uncharacterized protein n=1 Tax=Gordonia phage Gsput1 TaxID=1622193 RepID=A0A0E3T667_9CAUD|nr:hypothetical protein BH790_gp01 [Gordonia phage Gsput1]AKC03026.1 hypothetical protein Gsput1_1 [Gordonia phage Gsput1]